MSMCLSRPSHLHSHTAVSLSVCQPRFQSVSPVNDKMFGKSISFFLNQSPDTVLQQTRQRQGLCRRGARTRSGQVPHRGVTVEWPDSGQAEVFPLHHCLPPAALPRAAAWHQLLTGPQATLITELAEKQHSKQNRTAALGLWFSNFSVSSPLYTSKIEDPWKFLFMGVTSIYLHCIRNVNQDHF